MVINTDIADIIEYERVFKYETKKPLYKKIKP